MDPKILFDWTVSYGLGTVLAIGAAFGLWKLLFYVLRENSKREERLASIIESNLKSVNDGVLEAKNFLLTHEEKEMEWNKQILEALRFQRTEHERIIEALALMRQR